VTSWEIVALAAVSMLIADILSVLLVQAEARNRALMSGVLDAIGWGAGIIVTFSTISALGGHDMALKVAVIIGVTVANFAGSYIGTTLGRRIVHEDPTDTLTISERVARLETHTRFVDPPQGAK